MRRLTLLRSVAAVAGLIALIAAIAWLWRVPVADAVIRDALESRGVRATYTVRDVGTRWQRIENVRVGGPQAPDLVADWVELRVTTGLSGISVDAVRAGGVRLRGRVAQGRLTLGDLDKLLPKPSTESFSLPSIDLALTDARGAFDTPWGRIGAKLDGQGNLADGFMGNLAVVSPTIAMHGCSARQLSAFLNIGVTGGKPSFRGPLRSRTGRCRSVLFTEADIGLDLEMSAAFDRWRGSAAAKVAAVETTSAQLEGVGGRVIFVGDKSDTSGTVDLIAKVGASAPFRLEKTAFEGRFSVKDSSVRGTLGSSRVMLDPAAKSLLDDLVRGVASSPAEPMLALLLKTTRAAVSKMSFNAAVTLRGGAVTISGLRMTSATGARLIASGGQGLSLDSGGVRINTNLALSGGGLPASTGSIRQTSARVSAGLARIGPVIGRTGTIVLDPVRFAVNSAGAVRFETAVSVDGLVAGVNVTQLRFPLNATISTDGNFIVNNGCAPFAWQRLAQSGLTLRPASLFLCPVTNGALVRRFRDQLTGGAVTRAFRLEGVLGPLPFVSATRAARFEIHRGVFSLKDVSARMGPPERRSELVFGSANGRLSNGRLGGRFDRLAGTIANVPLQIDQGTGDWSTRDSSFVLRARARVSDTAVPTRFNPLMSENITLHLAGGRVAVTGTMQSTRSKTPVVQLTLTHGLETGIGSATLDVPGLRFDKSLQPEELTRLTLGVVANVDGLVAGRGIINWTAKGITSTGRFSTSGLNLAAAFGPVTGLKGEIVFDDLLALSTPPAQEVTIASINPGTLVTDGRIRYRLLPGQRIAIEDGLWPFAGGELRLNSTILDMREDRERSLTFRVVGLDAAKFIQRLEFENLAATGQFDGVLPIYFDASGGRIEGGRLAARAGGGTLAYVGEVSNAKMNVFAKLAFDALKSIRYENLTIELNGALDGEIVSLINFRGVNEAPLGPPRSLLARQFTGLPFIFNISVRAPFRSLLNTARTFQDPSLLLQRAVPELAKPEVQVRESNFER